MSASAFFGTLFLNRQRYQDKVTRRLFSGRRSEDVQRVVPLASQTTVDWPPKPVPWIAFSLMTESDRVALSRATLFWCVS